MMWGFRLGAWLGCLTLSLGHGLLCRAVESPMTSGWPEPTMLSMTKRLRPPVHPRCNVEDFPAVWGKYVRFRVFKTNVREPCIDELEIYRSGEPSKNVALARNGARATASGSLPGYEIHQVKWVNDGLYGNMHSWIAEGVSNVWVQIELPEPMRINRVVWGRDREGYLIDRLATEYSVEVSTNGSDWSTVASSEDRRPLPAGGTFTGYGPGFRQALLHFAPISTTLPPAGRESWSEYRVNHWQTEDGLPGNSVTALLQTRDGYLWIGTSAGLARFDGERFTRFGEQQGIWSSSVSCLFEDRAGTLWVGTDGDGLWRLENGRFRSLTHQDGLWDDVVMALGADAEGRLWIGTRGGLDCWHDGVLVRDGSLPPRRKEPVTRVLCYKDELWVAINGFLHQVKDHQYLRKYSGSEPGTDIAVAALRRGPSGRLWFGGLSGRLSTSSNGVLSLVPHPPESSPDTILDVCETRGGDLWLGMASTGLRRWRNGEVLSLTTQEGLTDDSIRCLLEDREGNLWVGTGAGGLNRLKPKKLRLVTTGDGLTHNVITSLAEDAEGNVWIGSDGGGVSVGHRSSVASRNVTDPALAVHQRLSTPVTELDREFTPAEVSYLLDNESISSVLTGHDGALWLGTWNGGLFRRTGSKLEQFNLAPPYNEEPLLALCEDRTGGLWVGTHQGGLALFKDGIFTSYRTINGLQVSHITTLALDGEGRLWIGTGRDGLYCLSNGQFTRYTAQDGLASDFVRTLCADGEGTLWVGMNGGLSRVKNGSIDSITTKRGLADDTLSQILEDDWGRLWFGSNRGIFRLSKEELNSVLDGRSSTLIPVVYGKAEGMESLECTGGFCPAGLKTRDGRLWFSTTKGLVIVDPKNMPINTLAPPVMLEELLVDGKKIDGGIGKGENGIMGAETEVGQPYALPSPYSGAPLRIAPGARHIEFHYTALGFTAPEKIHFRYCLEGLETGWVEAGGRRIVEYPYLPPGSYRFRVTACNEDGIWSERDASVTLTCLPAFWQTLWFRSLMAVIALSLAGWAARLWATRRLRRRLAVLQHQNAVEKERTRIARDIHDELGTLLTEISLLSDHGQKHLDRTVDAELDFRKISETALEAVQMADGIVWAINPRNDSIDCMADYLVHFVEDFFRTTSIRCRWDVPVDLPQIPLSTQVRHHFLLAVKETCNNIVRHSGASEVWLRITMTDKEFSVSVEDNGKGFCMDSIRSDSDGLFNIRQRMADVGGCCDLSTASGQGTRVKLTLPFR